MRTMLIGGLILAAATLAATAPAQASCVYNKFQDQDIRVNLNCGSFCNNKWTISPGNRECRPGKGGEYTVSVVTHGGYRSYEAGKGVVDDHGYVIVEGTCDSGVTVKSWRADHSLRGDYYIAGPLGC